MKDDDLGKPCGTLHHRSNLEATSALTHDNEAPGRCGPSTSEGNNRRASCAASRKTSPQVEWALLRRSVMTGTRRGMAGIGIVAADWVLEVLMCVAVKSGLLLQKVTTKELAGTDCGSNRAWAA
jgi:hypothetical protein